MAATGGGDTNSVMEELYSNTIKSLMVIVRKYCWERLMRKYTKHGLMKTKLIDLRKSITIKSHKYLIYTLKEIFAMNSMPTGMWRSGCVVKQLIIVR
ncbi:hypothetical protein TELCIR_11953 [Teladorsagia circumcincta]|uniref:Uncharacterized protein n=1 Tax=Teladorsagia circumcincta TaxID=45464 RepID=A0A2G9U831_TELCI|nr:hypothetical protein TELCIR_11953 [Teladorsagia circumcincta]